MASNWSTSSWFGSEWSGSVEQDVAVEYDVTSFLTDTTSPSWTIPLDGAVNNWFSVESSIEALDSVTQDKAASYTILLSAYSDPRSVEYDIVSTSGQIVGSPEFPFASAEQDISASYQVFFGASPSQDATCTYRVIQYAELVSTVLYQIVTGVTADGVCTYNSAGYVEQDVSTLWDQIASTERDIVASYQVINSATQDGPASYSIVTSPLTAGDNRTLTYSVYNLVQQDKVAQYQLLQGAEKDAASTYSVKGGAERDALFSYDLSGSVAEDASLSYQVNGVTPTFLDFRVAYNVNSLTKLVPNVVGFSLSKAKKRLEQDGFAVGQVTYQ